MTKTSSVRGLRHSEGESTSLLLRNSKQVSGNSMIDGKNGETAMTVRLLNVLLDQFGLSLQGIALVATQGIL